MSDHCCNNHSHSKIEQSSDFLRDNHSKAFINIDETGYNNYMNRRQRAQQELEEKENLKQEVHELKHLVKELISKLNN
jgi:hypothetical protein